MTVQGPIKKLQPDGMYAGLGGGDALEGKGPQRRPQKRLGRRLEERLPKRLGAVTVGCKCHGSRHLALVGQWLGVGWAPWRAERGVPPSLPMRPLRGGGIGHLGWGSGWVHRVMPNCTCPPEAFSDVLH